jgi:hypothetical protein
VEWTGRWTHDVGLVKGSDFLVRTLGLVLALNRGDRAACFVGVVDVGGHVSCGDVAETAGGSGDVVWQTHHGE